MKPEVYAGMIRCNKCRGFYDTDNTTFMDNMVVCGYCEDKIGEEMQEAMRWPVQTFEEYLMTDFITNVFRGPKDEIIDAYDSWICNKGPDYLIGQANNWGKTLRGRNEQHPA